MTVLVDATTAEHTRGIRTVIDGIVGELATADVDVLVARGSTRGAHRVRERHVAMARTRPGRLMYQRVLLPVDVALLQRRGVDIDRVLLLDSYMPLVTQRRVGYGALVHDVLPLTHPTLWSPPKRAVKAAAFRSLRRARPKLFTSTDHTANEIQRLLGLEATVVPFGCGQLSDQAADAALSEPLPVREPFLVAVGAFEPRKNLASLITSFEYVAPRSPDLHLRLIGGGSKANETAMLHRIARSRYRDRIHIHSNLGCRETVALVARATALVFPSLAEGFGLPALEALALGTPVVASDLPAIRSWAGDAVAYASPANPQAWIEPLEATFGVSDDDRRAGQELARGYRWRDCAAGLLDW